MDWIILDQLQADGRLSFKELARRINLSPPAVAERVRRLEESGVIAGYRAEVDPARAGHPITAFVELRCSLGSCFMKTTNSDDFPEVVEFHKLSGDRCSMAKVRVTSLEHLEGLLERLGRHGEMRSSLVLSTQYDGRPVGKPNEDGYMTATEHGGWSRPGR